ncbi:hypothetical protein BUALT_Bualt10G0065900 [Buddleja alternifolia]|uniref:Chlororespiratory reduction31 n=1 Tax=Buddleja alternifolia TaxID=168488 RepID=A0AAV6X585_9LAMI|nr:hypothetical protein BUALT_Bualt10G0065900 [Buddleja alternifolia]
MAASFHLQSPLLHKSHFLGQTNLTNSTHKPNLTLPKSFKNVPTAKFNLFESLGGRGLCNGEEGIEKELKKPISKEASQVQTSSSPPPPPSSSSEEKSVVIEISEDGFGKELLGLTGGFPGGEKGLQKFIEQNPPPKKEVSSSSTSFDQSLVKKSKPPELPMLLPGMIAIVKNPSNPFYMYCGIVQRITDGKAGVLFEGGNWDRLVTFRLEELERREKGPPMVNPRSAILEQMVDQSS